MATCGQDSRLFTVQLDASSGHPVGLQLGEDGHTVTAVDDGSLVATWNASQSNQVVPGNLLRSVNGQSDPDGICQELIQLTPLTLEVQTSKDTSNGDVESMLQDRIDLEQQSREASIEQLTTFMQQAILTVSNRMEELALTHAESQRQQSSKMRALSQLVADTQQAQQKQVIRLSRLEELRKGDLQRIEDMECDQKRLSQTLHRLTEETQQRSHQVNEALRGIAQDVTSLEQYCRNRRRPSKTDTVNGSEGEATCVPTVLASEQGPFASQSGGQGNCVTKDPVGGDTGGPAEQMTQIPQASSSMEAASRVRTTAPSSAASSPYVTATPAESEPAPLKLEAAPARLFTPESHRVSDNGKPAGWRAVSAGAAAMDARSHINPAGWRGHAVPGGHALPGEVQRPPALCSPRCPLSPRTAAAAMVVPSLQPLLSPTSSHARLLSPVRSAAPFGPPARPLSPGAFHLAQRPEAASIHRVHSPHSPRLTRMVQAPFPVLAPSPYPAYTGSGCNPGVWSQVSKAQAPVPPTPQATEAVGSGLPATERARRVTSPSRSQG
ncbi:unnamed protein product [Symbiodinium natans]|uniref:PDZ domain-containing protein n=1 Tax=Symbiodinium natans TaxID=878477 RepID=A0A812SQ14_9DINO|nr:unnamed protein product [Symbiodinium natans]